MATTAIAVAILETQLAATSEATRHRQHRHLQVQNLGPAAAMSALGA